MKKYILALTFALMTSASLFADNNDEPIDTVLNVDNIHRVIVTENPAGLNVDLIGMGQDSSYVATYAVDYDANSTIKSHQRFDMPFGFYAKNANNLVVLLEDLHFGFTGAVEAPEAMNTQMGKSFEIGIGEIISYKHKFGSSRRNCLTVGFGVNWRNYRMTGMNRFDMEDGGVIVTDYPDDVDARFSRIKVFSLAFPISYTYDSPLKVLGNVPLGFKLSGILNYNSHASILTCYDLPDGTKVKENYDKIGQRKFSIDVKLSVRVAPGLNLYFTYSPYYVLKCGPKFHTISTGISFGCL